MASNNFGYAHLLLFRCKQCNEPVAVPVMGQARNLEEIDGDTYAVKCRCGWSESLLGVEALAHWVVAWEGGKTVQHLTARTDEIGFTN
jgi:hypothetical protein